MAFFAHQPNQKREEFSTEICLLHSHYRWGIMLTTLRTLQKDTISLFARDAIQTPHEVIAAVSRNAYNCCGDQSEKLSSTQSVKVALGAAKSRVRQPIILKPGCISVEHCDQLTDENEGEVNGTEMAEKGKPDDPVSREENAVHAVNRLYSFITHFLKEILVAAKSVLLEDPTYLFVSWSAFSATVSQEILL